MQGSASDACPQGTANAAGADWAFSCWLFASHAAAVVVRAFGRHFATRILHLPAIAIVCSRTNPYSAGDVSLTLQTAIVFSMLKHDKQSSFQRPLQGNPASKPACCRGALLWASFLLEQALGSGLRLRSTGDFSLCSSISILVPLGLLPALRLVAPKRTSPVTSTRARLSRPEVGSTLRELPLCMLTPQCCHCRLVSRLLLLTRRSPARTTF